MQILQFSPCTIRKRRIVHAACLRSSDSCILSHINFTICAGAEENTSSATTCNKNTHIKEDNAITCLR